MEGDPLLRKKCRDVEKFDGRLAALFDDLKETLSAVEGLGLAAPQVGVLKRAALIVYDDKIFEVVNPEILETRGECVDDEGCLSVGDRRGLVRRPQYIKLKYFDRDGKERLLEAEDYFARVFFHEIDHLDGILFTDKIEEPESKPSQSNKKDKRRKRLMRVAFFGTPDFAVNSLRRLIESGREIVAVVCQPDKAGNRGKISCCAVKNYAAERGLKVFQFDSVSREGAETLRALRPDVIVTCAFGQFLSEEILSLAPFGVINVHASLLPAYRGASPVQSALINGETVTGVTIMRTVKKMDAGDIILSEEVPVGEEENFGGLFERLSRVGARLLDEALTLLEKGNAVFMPQDDSLATYCKKITKETEKIDFSMPAKKINDLIRGLSPAPCAYGELNGQRLKIVAAKVRADINIEGKAGSIVQRDGAVFVRCGDGVALSLLEVQPQNGRKMDIKSFCNGRRTDGCVFE